MVNTLLRSLPLASLAFLLVLLGCSGEGPLSPSQEVTRTEAVGTASSVYSVGSSSAHSTGPSEQACWGQATRVFAQMGEMGEHASQQPNPRLGLRNLARALYDDGVIPDDSMQALGQFVASVLGLSIDACTTE